MKVVFDNAVDFCAAVDTDHAELVDNTIWIQLRTSPVSEVVSECQLILTAVVKTDGMDAVYECWHMLPHNDAEESVTNTGEIEAGRIESAITERLCGVVLRRGKLEL
jgi:hypothetical protein